MDQRKWNAGDLERKVRRAHEALGLLLQPSGIPKRGTVLADLVYRGLEDARPDGFPTSSSSAQPALVRPSSQDGLRTNLDDALRRKREPGYATSPVERAAEALAEDVCDHCEGAARVPDPKNPEAAIPCGRCGGTGRRYHDPIGEAVQDICHRITDLAILAMIIDKKRQIVLHAGDSAESEEKVDNCHGCHRKVYGGRGDPIRRGLCGACSTRYYLWRTENGTNDESADRARFCGQRERCEGHVDSACDLCAELRRKTADEWRLDRADEMRRVPA